ncbi:hypothetical protein HHK36_004910 [Tetracentron sinense]|uniref:Uncharacterized protein n=1 Tax=Tetracentron sinense TaxID=13715 RepID=A0A835DMB8_TETSI|nr:hypothetical protein HHK36_004910 [Tetracentron sinense]
MRATAVFFFSRLFLFLLAAATGSSLISHSSDLPFPVASSSEIAPHGSSFLSSLIFSANLGCGITAAPVVFSMTSSSTSLTTSYDQINNFILSGEILRLSTPTGATVYGPHCVTLHAQPGSGLTSLLSLIL